MERERARNAPGNKVWQLEQAIHPFCPEPEGKKALVAKPAKRPHQRNLYLLLGLDSGEKKGLLFRHLQEGIGWKTPPKTGGQKDPCDRQDKGEVGVLSENRKKSGKKRRRGDLERKRKSKLCLPEKKEKKEKKQAFGATEKRADDLLGGLRERDVLDEQAHTVIGTSAGLSPSEKKRVRRGGSISNRKSRRGRGKKVA